METIYWLLIGILVYMFWSGYSPLSEGMNGPPVQGRRSIIPSILIKSDTNPRIAFSKLTGSMGQCISDLGSIDGAKGIYLGSPTGITGLELHGMNDCTDVGYKLGVDSGMRYTVPSQYSHDTKYGNQETGGFHVTAYPGFQGLQAVRFL